MRFISQALTICLVLAFSLRSLHAEPSASDFAAAVVQLHAVIKENARTLNTLGRERHGSAVVVDASGLLVTVGYLVLEAEQVQITFAEGEVASAQVIINDAATGLALLRVELPSYTVPMALGDSELLDVDQDVVVLQHGGTGTAQVVTIASSRDFSGSWEYHLERAFYTTPVTRSFSGAALVNRDAELVGIGSLLLSDIYASTDRRSASGNLFIPIEHLRNNFGRLLSGQPTEADRPWLGVTMNETVPDLQIVRVADDSPAAMAGMRSEDSIIAVNDQRVYKMADFYNAVWDAGNAGVTLELLIVRDGEILRVPVISARRNDWYR